MVKMFWLVSQPAAEPIVEPITEPIAEPIVIKAIYIPPVPLEVAPPAPPVVAPIELVREYCSSCMNDDGEIKCPRRHRCKTCHCYLTDDEWFAQQK